MNSDSSAKQECDSEKRSVVLDFQGVNSFGNPSDNPLLPFPIRKILIITEKIDTKSEKHGSSTFLSGCSTAMKPIVVTLRCVLVVTE